MATDQYRCCAAEALDSELQNLRSRMVLGCSLRETSQILWLEDNSFRMAANKSDQDLGATNLLYWLF